VPRDGESQASNFDLPSYCAALENAVQVS